jgi:hypothetical protein
MNRAATRLGAMITARASAGTLRPSFTLMVILTASACGVIDSIEPIGTPTTRTSSPGYRPAAEAKYPTTVYVLTRGHITYTPPISATTSAAMTA